jgi:hypothetical protein
MQDRIVRRLNSWAEAPLVAGQNQHPKGDSRLNKLPGGEREWSADV